MRSLLYGVVFLALTVVPCLNVFAQSAIMRTQDLLKFSRVCGLAIIFLMSFRVSAAAGRIEKLDWGHIEPCRIVLPEGDRGVYVPELWTDGIVPYDFDADVSDLMRDSVRDAMDELELLTDIQFIPRTDEPNYVHILEGYGNYSSVGMVGGMQELSINTSTNYVIIHELIHALGCWHEHQRPDRDTYVQINWENIESGWEYAFEMVTGVTMTGEYDFDSVMHYFQYAFRDPDCDPDPDGCETIIVLPPNEEWQDLIGQLTHLSDLDIVGLVDMYGSGCDLQPQRIAKLTADDAAVDDWFGVSVSISGDVAIIGADRDDDAGSASGSAYIFDVITGEQLHKLTADDAEAVDWFGYSVSTSGDLAIIGAHGDGGGLDSGSAYIFNVTTGEQLHKLTADDTAAFDWFGRSVSISGDVAIIGAYGDDAGGSNSGSAYVFNVTTGEQLHKLTAGDAVVLDFFGVSVSISGDLAIIGADGGDDGGSNSGSAYVFNVATGEQLHKLIADDGAADDRFGRSVSISGDVAIIGADWDDDGGSGSGSAYLFDVTTGEQLHKLTADDAAAGDWFGYSVSISGDVAIIGAMRDEDGGLDSGSAYIFNVITGNQRHKITAGDAEVYDYFGYSVSINGDIVITGAYGDDDGGSTSGSAYVFDVKGLDCNDNGIDDGCDIYFETSEDTNENGIPDECEEPLVDPPLFVDGFESGDTTGWSSTVP